MILYKYKSLNNLWHVLDIVLNQRVYCAHWKELNDPLEGKYQYYLNNSSEQQLKDEFERKVKSYCENLRIASFSTDPHNFLMWSHYAEGHRGCVIEVEINDNGRNLHEVDYDSFINIMCIDEKIENMIKLIFAAKTKEWAYEKEFRIIGEEKFFNLVRPIKRIFLGPNVDPTNEEILMKALPKSIKIHKVKVSNNPGLIELELY